MSDDNITGDIGGVAKALVEMMGLRELLAKTVYERFPRQTVGRAAPKPWLEVGPNDRDAMWYPIADAILSALAEHQLKVLPREPTEDMHVAMRDSAACQPDPPDGCLFFPDAAWRSGWDKA